MHYIWSITNLLLIISNKWKIASIYFCMAAMTFENNSNNLKETQTATEIKRSCRRHSYLQLLFIIARKSQWQVVYLFKTSRLSWDLSPTKKAAYRKILKHNKILYKNKKPYR